ncbi:PcF and SCR74-like cys-rich secreted peptide, putative [Phytophthora infestans T30-4]|uniref:PcF and SCR74-like cys-rich secreted peptide, putative n=2 Tax=Phytophthora infestans TaxID=4787 RepID=D0MV82_PHYIT|nr:PcF and SCR74-like cys-rich secreted peptide, putative [Phytophthora infestans T30-4]EEY61078.1 PcF and SCR74-like cys-rich secreted peptide, putative [Phytophthora infestans T30-4]KAF4042779.1 Phytotoxin PcF protein [Phytophthora infestans]KAF4127935.1 Phytotoxin PcF protein [Phytophthora infestans]|eukprot:XP_002907995.1 PcF and SCR74-like cys-rich secreted peptide, putative [Phytophthora infestans T30-4]
MNFKTCFAVLLAAVIATVATAEDPLYCQATGCPSLYPEANLALSRECRNQGKVGDDFHTCCTDKCGEKSS